MNRRTRLVSLLLAAAVLAAGCGSAASRTATPATPARPLSLATSLTTATGTWAAAVMGGSAASHNNFWQLFVRPTGASTWRLATPPGVASNGGLVLAGLTSGALLAGFRPSQDLTYSPLATTKSDGKSWSPGLLDHPLADLPGALAAAPGDGGLLALLADGTTEIASPLGKPWARLTTQRTLAESPAGSRCRPGSLTGAAFSPSGQPMLAASLRAPRDRRDLHLDPARPGSSPAPRCPPPTPARPSPCSGSAPAPPPPGAPDRRNRPGGTPAGRLVPRRGGAVGAVCAPDAERRHPDLGLHRSG